MKNKTMNIDESAHKFTKIQDTIIDNNMATDLVLDKRGTRATKNATLTGTNTTIGYGWDILFDDRPVESVKCWL